MKTTNTRRAALSVVAAVAVVAFSADYVSASNGRVVVGASSRRMLRHATSNKRQLSWSWTSLLQHLGPPPHPHSSSGSSGSTSGSSNGSSGDSSTDDVSSDSSTSSSDGSNNHASSTWGTVKCWMGMKQSCSDEEINNQAQGGGDVVNIGDTYNGGGNDGTASANSGASVAGIIGMAVGGVVLVAAVAAFLVGKARRVDDDEDPFGGPTRTAALLTKPGEDLESVDGTHVTGDPTIASGSTGYNMIEMAKRTKTIDDDAETGGGYINMATLSEDKGLVPELDYTESEGDSELMGMDYIDLDEVATGAPITGEGGPMWAAAAAAAAATGSAANPSPMSDEETEEISQTSSEAQESIASSVGYQPASVPDRVAALESTFLVPVEAQDDKFVVPMEAQDETNEAEVEAEADIEADIEADVDADDDAGNETASTISTTSSSTAQSF